MSPKILLGIASGGSAAPSDPYVHTDHWNARLLIILIDYESSSISLASLHCGRKWTCCKPNESVETNKTLLDGTLCGTDAMRSDQTTERYCDAAILRRSIPPRLRFSRNAANAAQELVAEPHWNLQNNLLAALTTLNTVRLLSGGRIGGRPYRATVSFMPSCCAVKYANNSDGNPFPLVSWYGSR